MTESTGKATRRRANGEGSVYRTSDGRIRGAISWTDARGTRHRRVVSGRTKADVRRSLAVIRNELERGLAPIPSGIVGDFLDGWLVASRQRIRAATWRQYEQSTRNYLKPALGRVALAKLAPSDVERMTADLTRRGRSPRTAALARAVLRRALADAQRDGLVHRNVAALARPPHVPSRSLEAGRDYLTADQLRGLLSASRLHPLGPLVAVAATTGIRQGEALGLVWADFDREARTLTVRRSMARTWVREGSDFIAAVALTEPKTLRSRRAISLPDVTIAALERQRGLQNAAREAAGRAWQDRDGLIFTDAIGRPLVGHGVTHAFHKILGAAGFPSVRFHALRHSAATALLTAGIPLKVVSEQLGHSTIAVTADAYAGVGPGLRREAADAMDRTLGGSATLQS